MKTKVPSLKGLIKGDLIIITGRKSPIEVVEKYGNTVLYMGPKSAQGMLIKKSGKVYDIIHNKQRLVKNIKVVGNLIFEPGHIKRSYHVWRKY